MRAIVFWNILAIVCLGFPAFILISACLQILQTSYLSTMLYTALTGLILLLLIPFIVLLANVVTLWNEDREEAKKERKE